ncbi:hypothetical protein QEH52_20035 [Coraliomargarita sp. SDUM461003]|uniref:Uncharacterized protein n=1 Tax=Thalassobacterium maritimum TaxID=3041265 RepID=A0ABU1B084_9BACT|nr:hypothetical protein [Coraliomargarita sp. SDUM461003]MDQ8209820.1 hypothetical protein [Coraliomargarita sp. SDUM461003]
MKFLAIAYCFIISVAYCADREEKHYVSIPFSHSANLEVGLAFYLEDTEEEKKELEFIITSKRGSAYTNLGFKLYRGSELVYSSKAPIIVYPNGAYSTKIDVSKPVKTNLIGEMFSRNTDSLELHFEITTIWKK